MLRSPFLPPGPLPPTRGSLWPHPTRPTPSVAGTSVAAHTTAAGAGWQAGRPAGRCCRCRGSALQERRAVGTGLGLCPDHSLDPSSPALTHAALQAAFRVRNLGGQGEAPIGVTTRVCVIRAIQAQGPYRALKGGYFYLLCLTGERLEAGRGKATCPVTQL